MELVSSQPPDDFPLPAIKLLFRMEGRKAGASGTNRLIKIKMVARSRGKIFVLCFRLIHITPTAKYQCFYLPKFPSAVLSSIVVALATTHSSALQMKIYSA